MANETTRTSVTELVYGEWINDYILNYAGHYLNPSQFFTKMDPKNGSLTVSAPRLVSDLGTADDDGVAVATAYNATDGTDLSNTELETEESGFTLGEYGIMRVITDGVMESATNAQALLGMVVPDGARILATAGNDDGCALFASFTNASGTSGTNCRVLDVDDAIYDLAERGVIGELVAIFDHQAIRDFQDDLQSQSSNQAVYGGAADRMMAVQPSGDSGRNVEGYTLSYKGIPFYRTGLTDTANTGADVVSAIFTRGDIESQKAESSIGQGTLRQFRLETERNASLRATEFVMTMVWGAGIVNNTKGQKLVTDAP